MRTPSPPAGVTSTCLASKRSSWTAATEHAHHHERRSRQHDNADDDMTKGTNGVEHETKPIWPVSLRQRLPNDRSRNRGRFAR